MRIAIVGTGISGLTAAFLLHKDHDISVFEAGNYIGGHTHTVTISVEQKEYAIDTGFIVYNEHTYPNFTRLLRYLGIATQPSDMSFSVRCARSGVEYASSSLNTIFAQRRNLWNISFWRMLLDIVRFSFKAKQFLQRKNADLNLEEFLDRERFSPPFVTLYIVPMLAAIWSTDPAKTLNFPALHFFRFLHNHGLLNLWQRPQWRVITGGSSQYIPLLTRGFSDRIRLETPVLGIKRYPDSVEVRTHKGTELFDHVVLAVHSDQAL